MILNKLQGFFNSTKKRTQNLFNESFLSWVGSSGTKYDSNGKTYLEKGYNINSVVYSIIQQQSRKTAHVPFFIKKVEKESEAKTFIREVKQANVSQPQMKLLLKNLEKKAFLQGEGHLNMPILKPNVSQSWNEFIALYKTMLKLNGNVYIYMLAPDEGAKKGVPMGFYILPSHMVNIVLKVNANLLSDESPVDHYTMIENSNYIEFPEDSIVHIKYPNPNFDLLGSHLYGASPLRPALDNIESSNEAMNQNIKTLKNGGSYGFVHGKSQPITPDQAKELKSRLKEMDDNPERLSRIAGISAEIGFTRLSLTTDELRPFEYLDYDQKQICNVLGWSDKLLNNSEGAKYDNVKEYRKQVLTDDILPDLDLLEAAFNEIILPRFKGYENTLLYFDATTLPEMQADMNTLTVWLSRALLDGVISRNEYREAMNYPKQDSDDFERFTTKMGIVPLEETFIEEQPDLLIDEEKAIVYKAGFDKNQPRGENGQWGGGVNNSSFKDWFKGSKVVNKDGSPKKVYHGTCADFEDFDLKKLGSGADQYGAGFYFAGDPEQANGYSGCEGGNIKSGFLNIKNPILEGSFITKDQVKSLLINSPDFEDVLYNFGDWGSLGKEVVLQKAVDSYYHRYGDGRLAGAIVDSINGDFYNGLDSEFVTQLTKSTGFDGRIIEDRDIYVMFNPSQFKYTIGTDTTKKLTFSFITTK